MLYTASIWGENLHVWGGKWLLAGKNLRLHACTLILPIDKAIICGKRFAIEWKIAKTAKVFPLEYFAVYSKFSYELQAYSYARVCKENKKSSLKFQSKR